MRDGETRTEMRGKHDNGRKMVAAWLLGLGKKAAAATAVTAAGDGGGAAEYEGRGGEGGRERGEEGGGGQCERTSNCRLFRLRERRGGRPAASIDKRESVLMADC